MAGLLAAGLLAVLSGSARAADGLEVLAVSGAVRYRAPGSLELKDVRKGDSLAKDVRIKLEKGGSLQLKSPMGDELNLKDEGYLKLAELVPQGATQLRLDLFRGNVKSKVAELKPGSFFEVKTPVAVAGVRGTVFECQVANDGATMVAVEKGEVQVRDVEGASEPVQVKQGERASVQASGQVSVTSADGGTRSATTTASAASGAATSAAPAASAAEDLQEALSEISEAIVEQLQQKLDEQQVQKLEEAVKAQQQSLRIQVEIKDRE